MHFAEAEKKYRELEDQLLSGAIEGDEFVAQVAQLRVTDEEGRHWMLSARTGRWLLHDGQQWVFAEPPRDAFELEEVPVLAVPEPWPDVEEIAITPEVPAYAPEAAPPERIDSRPLAPRLLLVSFAALMLVACLVGGGVAAWVLVLRDGGEPTPVSAEPTMVSLVETYTPRPATPTFTSTPSPTPSRTPMSTNTPITIATLPPTSTPLVPSPTPALGSTVVSSVGATATATATATPTPVAVAPSPTSQTTYVVQQGDTLFEIALRFGVTVKDLAEANGITNTALIRPGMVLVIPVPGATVVAVVGSVTPTWTPLVLNTPAATATATGTPTRTSTPTPTPTPGPTKTPTPTPRPTRTPTPTKTPRPLSGKIAFTVWNPYLAYYELYVSRIDGTGRNRIGEGFRQPQIRSDGNMLVANGDGAPNYEHLVKMNLGGDQLEEISNNTEDSYPNWAPQLSDNNVVYSSTSHGDRASRLGIVETLGKNSSWIMIGMTEVQGEYPFWMADNRVVYHGCDFLGEHTDCGLFWVPVTGGNYRQLTTHQSDTAPAGYGNRVAFMSARDGNWEVYTVNMDGSGLMRLTNSNSHDGLPTWSPDGKSIAFVSNRGGAWAIWAMEADGSTQRKLFDLGGGYGSGEYDWTHERISWAP
jgi:LysM repeat protein